MVGLATFFCPNCADKLTVTPAAILRRSSDRSSAVARTR
jgi:hypothetical protein